MSVFKVKLLLLGPMESGKTVIANFLSKATELQRYNISPTQGVRILEFEQSVVLEGRNTVVDVELWDCSGDPRYETCWPAFSQDTNGIIFVFNPDRQNHDKELEAQYDYFVRSGRIKSKQCLLLSLRYPATLSDNIPPSFHNVYCIETCLETNPDGLREQFEQFLSTVLLAMSEKRNQEELSIMNRR